MRLTEASLLHDFGLPEHAALRQAFVPMRFTKGQMVYQPREHPNRLFIVSHGRVRVYLAYRDKEFTIAVLDAGDVFVTHTRAYVQALEEVELQVAKLAEVRRLLVSMPSLTASMIRVLGDLLSHAFSVIDNLAFKDVRNRLLNFLVYEAVRLPRCNECRACGACEAGGMVSLGLNTEQLATIIGSTRQTVSSLLNTLAMESVIQLKGKGVICIPDIASLEALLAD